MSNEYAIAAVTLTLRNLLDRIKLLLDSDEYDDLPDDAKPAAEILVTNLPLDEAYKFDKAKNQVNLFLYHIEHSAAWRNMDIPGQIKDGETGHTPLALNLYYIITAYGENGSELIGHLLLGKAMSLLHDHSIFGRSELKNAFVISGLHNQIERVRITPQPISLDEVSKLWTGFQTQYRLSAAYQVDVVLIESKRSKRTPLPVLTRGPGDEGVLVQPHLLPPYPTLEKVILPDNQTGARLGDTLILSGHHLEGDNIIVSFTNSRLPDTIHITPESDKTDREMKVKIPGEPDKWPAGFYHLLAVINKAGEQDRTTNKMTFALVPHISNISISPLSPPATKKYLATVTCSPEILPEQKTVFLLGDCEFPVQSFSTKTNTVTFQMLDVPDGEYYCRLRIDGVDSLLIDSSVTPPVFDVNQKVTIP